MVNFRAVAQDIRGQWQEAQYAKDPILWARDKSGDFFWSKQREVMESLVMNKRTLVASCHGSGKAQRSDEWVRTANRGWVRAGDITTQDRLFDEHGRPCRVVAVRRWQDRPTWRLTFSDGATVDVDENHEWNTILRADRPSSKADWRDHWCRSQTWTTGKILDTLRTRAGRVNHFIPLAKPLDGEPDLSEAAGLVDPRRTYRAVVGAQYLGRAETVCFEVDSPSHLYLVGESLIPTHNSYLASRAAGWWLDTHPHDPTETRVITTAPSWNQVKNVMWAYLEAVKTAASMGGRINGKAEWVFPGFTTPTAMGRKPADYDDSTFQGFHPTYPLVVIDEAGGVSENIFTSVETITTNEGARILAIANPDNPNSYLAKIWREQEALPPGQRDWNLIRISAFDTPNFTGEKVPEKLKKNLLQKEWVADAERRWGKEDPRYQSKVLAVFPEIGEDGLFNLGRVLESMNSYHDFDYDPEAPVVLGVDVGLSISGDFSVIAANQGGKVTILDKVKGWDGNRLARRIGEWCDMMKVSEIRVDAIGVGRGVQAVLENHVPENVRVSWIVGNEASPDNLKWYNFRAAMYDTVSQKINRGELAIPSEEAQGEKTEGLFDEFRAIKYEYRGSRLLLESKEQIKKNIQRKGKGKSPDVLDAIVYACLDLNELTGREGETVTSDTLLAESDDLFAADEWGNEVWSFAPA